MPVHQTGWNGEAIVPCSHCNANDKGPEAGICHRSLFGSEVSCIECKEKAGYPLGFVSAIVTSATGIGKQIPCSYCDGKGYRRL
jgi:hypothetical protein